MKPLSSLIRNLAAIISTALLAACGGGGDAPFPISNVQAVNALSHAKSANATLITQWVSLSNAANPILALTAASWPSGSGTGFAFCKVAGDYSFAYSKAFSGAGLSTGDYYSITYSGCVQNNGEPVLRGNVIISATTETYTDQSAGAFSLPVSLQFNDYREDATNYNGAVNYSTNSVGKNGAGSENVVASSGSLTVTTANSTTRYSHAAMVYNVLASGTTTSGTAFDVNSSPSGTQMSVNASLVGAPSAPSSGSVTASNVFGGRVIGTFPNQIQIDDGNDGFIDATLVQAF